LSVPCGLEHSAVPPHSPPRSRYCEPSKVKSPAPLLPPSVVPLDQRTSLNGRLVPPATGGLEVPTTLPSGPTTLRFRNDGKHPHELNIVQLKSGASLKQFIDAANAGKPLSPMIERVVGVLFAKPGERSPSGLSVDLAAGGVYAIQCIFKDSSTAPAHRALGMFTSFAVTNARASSNDRPAATVDTIVANDYAFTYPRTVAPGRHRFVFVNAGKQRHEINVARLKAGVTPRQIAEADQKDADINPLLDQALGVLHALGGQSPAGMLELEMVAGRVYLLECGFSDTEKSPPHYKLGMSGTITVTGR